MTTLISEATNLLTDGTATQSHGIRDLHGGFDSH